MSGTDGVPVRIGVAESGTIHRASEKVGETPYHCPEDVKMGDQTHASEGGDEP